MARTSVVFLLTHGDPIRGDVIEPRLTPEDVLARMANGTLPAVLAIQVERGTGMASVTGASRVKVTTILRTEFIIGVEHTSVAY